MAELQIFNNEEFGEVRIIENNTPKHHGYFYILEYPQKVKIGCTKNPYSRIKSLLSAATKYGNSKIGRFSISSSHTNYRDNEKYLHEYFRSKRVPGTELFCLDFENAISEIQTINMDLKDESDALERRADMFLDGMKNFLMGGA